MTPETPSAPTELEPLPAPESPGARELRLALAMRGGVSLAVWIGGAVAEIDLLRLAGDPDLTAERLGRLGLSPTQTQRVRMYRSALVQGAFTGVRVDVLAGASAGGLNAVLYGFAQAAGIGVDWAQAVWQTQGDLWGLMRPSWRPGKEPFGVPSLLMGSDTPDGFADRLYKALAERSSSPVPAGEARRPPPRLTVDLAATLVSGPKLKIGPGRRQPRRATAGFRFLHTSGVAAGPLNHFPGTDSRAEDRAMLLRRLAFAARATSSFPGAFEKAHIWSRVGPSDDDESALPFPEPRTVPADMSEVFSDLTSEHTCFEVMDGGIFDNIPISRALDAIAAAHADGPVRRVMLYLDPAPPRRPAMEPTDLGRFGREFWIGSLRKVAKLRQYDEHSEDEVARIREHNSIAATIPPLLPDPTPEATLSDYCNWRAHYDAARVVARATRPGGRQLSDFWLPATSDTADNALDQDDAVGLETLLRTRLRNSYASGQMQIRDDAQSLLLCTERVIDRLRTRATTPQMRGYRRGLFQLRTVAQVVRDDLDAQLVESLLSWQVPVDHHRTKGPRTTGVVPRNGILAAASPAPESTAVDERSFWAVLDERIGQGPTPGRGSGPNAVTHEAQPLHEAWTRLATLARQSEAFPHWVDGEAAITDNQTWCVHAGAPAFKTPVEFVRLTGDELTNTAMPTLEAEAATRLVESLVRAPRGHEDQWKEAIRGNRALADSRLAGNALANFAGFLHSRWRDHDWTWGKLNAASSLGNLLDMTADQRRQLEASTLLSTKGQTVPLLDRPKPSLADLAPRRRYALGARATQLLLRALWPLTPRYVNATKTRFQDYLIAIPLMVLRPVLVLLPLLLRPLLLLTLLFGAVAVHRLVSPPPSGASDTAATPDLAANLALLLLLGSGVVALVRLGFLYDAWKRVGKAWQEAGSTVGGGLASAIAARARWARIATLIVGLGLIAVIATIPDAGPWTGSLAVTPTEFALLTLAVAAAPHVVRQSLTKLPRRNPTRVGFVRVAAGALALALLLGYVLSGQQWSGPECVNTACLSIMAAMVVAAVEDAWVDNCWRFISSGVTLGVAFVAQSEQWTALINSTFRGIAHQLVEHFSRLVAAWLLLPTLVGMATFAVVLSLAKAHAPARLVAIAGITVATVGATACLDAWGGMDWTLAPLMIGAAAAAASTLVAPATTTSPGDPN